MDRIRGTDNHEYFDENGIRAEKNEPEALMKVDEGKPTDGCKTLKAACVEWKEKVESFKTRFSAIKRDESPVKRKNDAVEETYKNDQEVDGASRIWMLKVESVGGVKSAKGRGLSNNDHQEMCSAWMDKVARIKDPPSLKKHADKTTMIK
ncbi:1164_t:CDS:2 [Dentiscutata heterogama]|uniref:1164_t:CDS:1 n=1 Tax=Dentiscutata heterogama TaxID=1316150 RepID=A0ACA9MYK8_9GLOM|nr:1164_t:CDS:2 [Dentiscutata heterogama]